jgi:beta-N-acetylhexosaminidase
MLRKNPPFEVAAMANQLQRDSQLPLLLAADFERGLASRVSFTPAFPDVMAFGAIGNANYVERFAAITAEEARALGIHWNFSPVADVNSNPANPIINTRSFGEDPAAVGGLVAAFVKGAKAHGMLTTVKHFPGHGDTAVSRLAKTCPHCWAKSASPTSLPLLSTPTWPATKMSLAWLAVAT